MRTGFPCNESRFFPVIIDLKRVPCKPYRVWVFSADPSKGQTLSKREETRLCSSLLYITDFNQEQAKNFDPNKSE